MPNDNNTAVHTKFGKKLLKLKRQILSQIWLVRAAIIASVLILLIFLSFLIVKSANFHSFTNFSKIVSNFIFAPKDRVKSSNGRVNILVMGIGGEGHTGPDLTDTMIVVSVPLNNSQLVTISIPRDIWIPEIRAKINSAYYWGNQKKEGGGLPLSKSTIESVLGIPIHYGLVLDFSAFEKIINDLDGVDVNVENAFTDNLYPIKGMENDLCDGDPQYLCRYETITFEKGIKHMDGATALKFVRSRYSEGTEGTDIARETRQQKVIDATKAKALSPKVFLNVPKDVKIWKDIDSSLVRDISNESGAVVARKILKSKEKAQKYLIPESLLLNPPISNAYDRQYVFTPKLGNGRWEEINKWVGQILN